jgi:hypothetical protein
MFKLTPTTPLPLCSAVAKSFTKLMHDISGDSIDPIRLKVITPPPTHPNATTPLPIQPKVMLSINPPSNPPHPHTNIN